MKRLIEAVVLTLALTIAAKPEAIITGIAIAKNMTNLASSNLQTQQAQIYHTTYQVQVQVEGQVLD
jgi:hypothetical protein